MKIRDVFGDEHDDRDLVPWLLGVDATKREWSKPNREDMECWCPDGFVANDCVVDYCPRHGDNPDYSLLEHAPRPRITGI